MTYAPPRPPALRLHLRVDPFAERKLVSWLVLDSALPFQQLECAHQTRTERTTVLEQDLRDALICVSESPGPLKLGKKREPRDLRALGVYEHENPVVGMWKRRNGATDVVGREVERGATCRTLIWRREIVRRFQGGHFDRSKSK